MKTFLPPILATTVCLLLLSSTMGTARAQSATACAFFEFDPPGSNNSKRISAPSLPPRSECNGRIIYASGKGWQCATEKDCESAPTATLCELAPNSGHYGARNMQVTSPGMFAKYRERPGTLEDACVVAQPVVDAQSPASGIKPSSITARFSDAPLRVHPSSAGTAEQRFGASLGITKPTPNQEIALAPGARFLHVTLNFNSPPSDMVDLTERVILRESDGRKHAPYVKDIGGWFPPNGPYAVTQKLSSSEEVAFPIPEAKAYAATIVAFGIEFPVKDYLPKIRAKPSTTAKDKKSSSTAQPPK